MNRRPALDELQVVRLGRMWGHVDEETCAAMIERAKLFSEEYARTAGAMAVLGKLGVKVPLFVVDFDLIQGAYRLPRSWRSCWDDFAVVLLVLRRDARRRGL